MVYRRLHLLLLMLLQLLQLLKLLQLQLLLLLQLQMQLQLGLTGLIGMGRAIRMMQTLSSRARLLLVGRQWSAETE